MPDRVSVNYALQPAALEHLEATVDMFNAWAQEKFGAADYNTVDLANEWQVPGFDLSNDARLALSPEGRVLGYIDAWDVDEPHTRVQFFGHVHPEYTGLGIGAALMEWGQQRARQALLKAPAEARVTMTAFCLSTDQQAQALFLKQGFKFIRHSLTMLIDFAEAPVAPDWPAGIAVRTMQMGQDERRVVQAVRDSFQDHFGYVEHPFEDELALMTHFWRNDPTFDPGLAFLAMDGEQVAGISLCRPSAHHDPDLGWVNTLGVCRPWRRQGLGLALLQHSFQALYALGRRRVGLGVDAESLTGATRLYLRAGMRSDPARQYSQYEKELRSGVELGTQRVED